MNAVDYLKRQGLAVRLSGKRVRVSPASRLTDEMRQHIRQHKPEIINELLRRKRLTLLASVARELSVSPGYLLEQGFIDRHDLEEQLDADPRQLAALIKTNPRWKQ